MNKCRSPKTSRYTRKDKQNMMYYKKPDEERSSLLLKEQPETTTIRWHNIWLCTTVTGLVLTITFASLFGWAMVQWGDKRNEYDNLRDKYNKLNERLTTRGGIKELELNTDFVNERGGRPLLGSTYNAAKDDYFVCSGTDRSPRTTMTKYDINGGNTTEYVGVSLDANWRWKYKVEYDDEYKLTVNCDFCKGLHNQDPVTTMTAHIKALEKYCPQACKIKSLVETIETGKEHSYEFYGITKGDTENSLKLKYIFKEETASEYNWRQGGTRVYLTELMDSLNPDSAAKRYYPIQLGEPGSEEFTFTLDVSKVPCGFNAAVYLVAIDLSPGLKLHDCGVGYADAQCPTDLQVNADGITAGNALNGPNVIHHCATELDLFEVNREAQAFTMHACDENTGGVHAMCNASTGANCVNRCDRNGCDWNVYRLSPNAENQTQARAFFGSVVQPDVSMTIDTSKPITVRTWYNRTENSWNQELIQDGNRHSYPPVNFNGWDNQHEQHTHHSVTDDFCDAFDDYLNGDGNKHTQFGGNQRMIKAQNEGYVLVLSIWTENDHNNPPMRWLDSTLSNVPDGIPDETLGIVRGRCPKDEWQWGSSPLTEEELKNIEVVYSDFRIGPMGKTVPQP